MNSNKIKRYKYCIRSDKYYLYNDAIIKAKNVNLN